MPRSTATATVTRVPVVPIRDHRRPHAYRASPGRRLCPEAAHVGAMSGTRSLATRYAPHVQLVR